MSNRIVALSTASSLITTVRDSARQTEWGLATVGVISSNTLSQAVIPAGINFTVDIRCSKNELWGIPESEFDPDCDNQQSIEMQRQGGYGAWTIRAYPTSMIFVPRKSGISHNSNKNTGPQHCALFDDEVKSGVF
ncbi:hypothetical protein GQ44DRAFT_751951 [Phaeosphaeriaceae sp. PMI808]|nr:hypothetical protein GQ44DRAFT_751951 [Phaeosphaeriaceae sp. PMI808]